MNVIFQLDVGSCKSFISNENAHITNNDSNNNKVGDELGNSKFFLLKLYDIKIANQPKFVVITSYTEI